MVATRAPTKILFNTIALEWLWKTVVRKRRDLFVTTRLDNGYGCVYGDALREGPSQRMAHSYRILQLLKPRTRSRRASPGH